MRLRWITVLAALILKIALIAAIFLLGRLVLQRDYVKLEREHVQADVRQVVLMLQWQLDDFDIMAHDYAS